MSLRTSYLRKIIYKYVNSHNIKGNECSHFKEYTVLLYRASLLRASSWLSEPPYFRHWGEGTTSCELSNPSVRAVTYLLGKSEQKQ